MQQRNFENCIIQNQIVVVPNHIVCLSDIRVRDMRKFVYYTVLEKFSQLHPNNIELAYKLKNYKDGDQQKPVKKYVSLAGLGNLTMHELIER